MNKIQEYLYGDTSAYRNPPLMENDGWLNVSPVFISLKWTGDSQIRLTIKREDTSIESLPLFEISGVLDTIDIITEKLTYKNNTSIVPKELIDIGDPTIKAAREFSACLNPGVPFPDLTGRPTDPDGGIFCEGGEDEVAFSLTDLNPEPGPMFTVTLGGQSEGDVAYTGTIQQLYEYLLSQSGIEVVLLSRDLPDAEAI